MIEKRRDGRLEPIVVDPNEVVKRVRKDPNPLIADNVLVVPEPYR